MRLLRPRSDSPKKLQRPGVGTLSLVLLPGALSALVLGVLGGAARITLQVKDFAPDSSIALHGPLLVFGFLGTLIAAERAIVLRRYWGYLAPCLGVIGTVSALAGARPWWSGVAWSFAAFAGLCVVIGIDRAHPTLATKTMIVSGCFWFLGASLWTFGLPLLGLLPWWGGFLALMILGERTQFGRLFQQAGESAVTATRIFVGLLLLGATLGLFIPNAALRVSGIGFILMGLWLLLADVPRHVIKPGLLRFLSIGTTLAYVWLVVTGVLWSSFLVSSAQQLDASIHALLQGFVLGMVIAHSLIVFPAISGKRLPFHPIFYGHLVLFHAATSLRIVGDLLSASLIARAGSLLSAGALLLFVVVTLSSVGLALISSRRR